MSVHRQQGASSSRSTPYPLPNHHRDGISRDGQGYDDAYYPQPSGSVPLPTRRSHARAQLPDEASFLPSNDRNEWYYPAARQLSQDIVDDDLDVESLPIGQRSEEALRIARSRQGNWGNKLVKGSRLMRRGKIVAWGPHKTDLDSDDRARKRLLKAMPRSRSPSPEIPTLPHLRRSPTPPLVATYPEVPSLNHHSLLAFILDPTVQHAFTSPHFSTLQDTATELIAGESAMRKAFGGLWRVLQGDLQRRDPDNEEIPRAVDEDEEEDAVPNVDVERSRGQGQEGGDELDVRDLLRRSRVDPSMPEIPPLSHLFVSPIPVALGAGSNGSGAGPVPAPGGQAGGNGAVTERLISPQSQLETFEWCLGVMRELADHGKEYLSRLEEIRNGLGEARATRTEVWKSVRMGALDDLEGEDLIAREAHMD